MHKRWRESTEHWFAALERESALVKGLARIAFDESSSPEELREYAADAVRETARLRAAEFERDLLKVLR